MSPFIQSVEKALLPVAATVTPDGSEPRAVVHQWMFALAHNQPLFAANKGITNDALLDILTKNQLFSNLPAFKNEILSSAVIQGPAEPTFTFIDLFAGIGGMRIAFQKAGGSCVFSSEYDKSAQSTYLSNHGDLPLGDIKKIDERDIPNHDILVAGFPCQPFSHAGVSARTAIGKEHGFNCESQGNLFFDIMRIVHEKRPKVLFLENVKNIERHDEGRTFQVIKDSVEEAGYSFRYSIIDSSSLVPQRRVRCYMVCIRKDAGAPFEFPLIDGPGIPLKTILEENVPEIYTISDKLWQGHINRTQRNLDRGTGFTAHTADLNKPSNTLVARYGKDGKECLIPQNNKNPRLLTPRECARLQGFPENFILPTARTPAYKQFGNSVAVPVISKLANKLIRDLM